jgi:hypothetical protein
VTGTTHTSIRGRVRHIAGQRAPAAAPPGFVSDTSDGLVLRLGLVLVAVLGILYLAIGSWADNPLAVFVLAPLVVATVGSPRHTLLVGAVALVVGGAVTAVVGGLDGAAVTIRLVIVALGTVFGAATSEIRRRHRTALVDASSTAALLHAFQRRLVPMPYSPAGVAVDERYRPGEQRMELGGDFLDAITLPDGALGFIIGDVSGHGPDEAAFGVAVRAGWKGIAVVEPDDPARWLTGLDVAFFADGRFDGFVTALAGRIDPRTRRATIVSAGHCWPIIVGPNVRMVEMVSGPPLGLGMSTPRRTFDIEFGPHEALLAYTDGLTENHRPDGSGERWGEDALLSWLRRQPGQPKTDLDALLAEFGPAGFVDDVAVVLFTPDPLTAAAHGLR